MRHSRLTSSGLSLLEALVVLTIVAVFTRFAIFETSDWLARQRAATTMHMFQTAINFARQSAAALNTDIGVMTSIMPAPDCGSQQAGCGAVGSELADQHLDNLAAYTSLLGVSARRDLTDPVALQGEALFSTIGCDGCHTPAFQTSPYHPHAELRDQTIHPYTDLLLHDMGPGLASNLAEGNASGAEWRTAPLWNIGLTAGVSGGEAYLHDGRARTLDEAIRWHGGEADASQQAYVGLTQGEKDALIAFLKSL